MAGQRETASPMEQSPAEDVLNVDVCRSSSNPAAIAYTIPGNSVPSLPVEVFEGCDVYLQFLNVGHCK